MRRLPSWLLRAVRDDSGLTAVEYAVLCGLVIAVAGAAAFFLGQGVHKSSGKVAWAGHSSSTAHGPQASSSGPRLVGSQASTSVVGSALPWALLSLGVTIASAGSFLGWHYLRDWVRHNETRRRVRQSLTDVGGQTVMERMMPGSAGTPGPRHKRPDTTLIGRNSPDLHHWLKGRDVNLSAKIVDAGATARFRPASPQSVPAPLPAVPVAG